MVPKEILDITKENFHDISKEVEDLINKEQPPRKEMTKVVCFDKIPLIIPLGGKSPNQYDIL